MRRRKKVKWTTNEKKFFPGVTVFLFSNPAPRWTGRGQSTSELRATPPPPYHVGELHLRARPDCGLRDDARVRRQCLRRANALYAERFDCRQRFERDTRRGNEARVVCFERHGGRHAGARARGARARENAFTSLTCSTALFPIFVEAGQSARAACFGGKGRARGSPVRRFARHFMTRRAEENLPSSHHSIERSPLRLIH